MPSSTGRSDGDLADLITGIVDRTDETWGVTWASDGATPPARSGRSLTSVTDQAAADVASLYARRPATSGAELQFAIYPWTGRPGNVILDVQRSIGGFTARDIQGSDALVQGTSLEDLVREAERRLPKTDDAMLRWIRPVSELISEYGDRLGDRDDDTGGFDPMEAAEVVSERLAAEGLHVTAADVLAVMSVHAELTGHGDPETDEAARSAAVTRVADATGRRPDIVARIYDEVDRFQRG